MKKIINRFLNYLYSFKYYNKKNEIPPIYEWERDEVECIYKKGYLECKSLSNDPKFICNNIYINLNKFNKLKIKIRFHSENKESDEMKIYWMTQNDDIFSEEKSISIFINFSKKYEEYLVEFEQYISPQNGELIKSLRFDPCESKKNFDIKEFKFLKSKAHLSIVENSGYETKILRAFKNYRYRRIYLDTYPIYYYLTLTNKCNCSCIMCVRNYRKSNNRDIDDEIYEYYKREFFPNARTINFSTTSEPLMYKKWDKLVEDCLNFRFQPVITTNFQLANKEKIKKLVEAKFIIKISLDAIDKKKYEFIRGGDINKVLSNIEYLMSLIQEQKADISSKMFQKKPEVQIHITPLTYNIEELMKIAKKAVKLNIKKIYIQDFIEIQENRHLSYRHDLKKFLSAAEEMIKFLYENNVICETPIKELAGLCLELKSGIFGKNLKSRPREKKKGYKNCFWPFFAALINSDQQVLPCCFMHSYVGKLTKYNLKLPFSFIWNNINYRNLRKNIINNRPDTDCLNCAYAIDFESIDEDDTFVD